MKFDILTLFPNSFAPLTESIVGRARENGKLDINLVDIREFSKDKHKKCDDTPYGGGEGMVMTPQPLWDAIESVKKRDSHIIYLTPKGEKLTQKLVEKIAEHKNIVLICGHYEGIDQRVIDHFVHQEISIGDYVLTGGELPAMVLVDAVSRLIPEVLGNENSAQNETFSNNLLEFPQYTKPSEFKSMKVPEVLLSGNHKEIEKWRLEQSEQLTKDRRPDLMSCSTQIIFKTQTKEKTVERVVQFLKSPNRKTFFNNICKSFNIQEDKLTNEDFLEYATQQTEAVWEIRRSDMENLENIYQNKWNNISNEIFEKFESFFGEKLEKQKLMAYIWPAMVCPYDNTGFYVSSYIQGERWNNILKTSIHEIIHQFWWQIWDTIFAGQVDKLKYEYPSVSWFLSEIAIDIVGENSGLNSYYDRNNSYDTFYNIKIQGRNLMQEMNLIYRQSKNLINFMKNGYEFLQKNIDEFLNEYNK